MMNSQDLNLILCDSINYSVVTIDDFSDRFLMRFRNHSSRIRKCFQCFYSFKYLVGEQMSEMFRIASYEIADCFDIIQCLKSPPYSSHLSRRFLASS